MKLPQQHKGFTLVELMVSVTVSSLLLLGVVSAYSSQATTFMSQARRTQATEDGRDVYLVLSRLLRQAESSSVSITSSPGNTSVDFIVPAGYPIWPNTTSPFAENAIRISWSSGGSNVDQIRVAKSATTTGLPTSSPTTLAGSSDGANTRITNLFLAPDSGGYMLSITSRAGGGTGQHVAEVSFEGVVIPRN